MISIEKKFVFIHIPKTGGNAIRLVLEPYSVDEIVFNKKQAAYNEDQGRVHRFGIRNPYMDLGKHAKISQIRELWSEADLGAWDDYFRFGVIRNPWDRLISFYFSPHLNRVEFDREEFLNFIRSDKVEPQFDYVAIDGSVVMDRMIRFEALSDQFSEVCDQLQIPCNLQRVNQSAHRPYQEYYDRELLDVVNEHHHKDIEAFEYSFE